MAEHELLAERLVGYTLSELLRDLPQMRRDLVEASELLTAYAALLDAWKDVFVDVEVDADTDRLKPDLIQLFAGLAAAAGGETRKNRGRANVIIRDDREDAASKDRP
jgi:hypothetical protein